MPSPVLPISALAELRREIHVEREDGSRQLVTRLDDACYHEGQALKAAHRAVTEALKEQFEARTGPARAVAKRKLSAAVKRLNDAKWYLSLYEAIRSSLGVQGRHHVFGVRVARGRASVQLRAEFPKSSMHRDCIWMDATANPVIWRALLGRLNVEKREHDIPVEIPGHYHLTQFADRVYSKKMLTEAKGERSSANIHRMRCVILEKFYELRRRGRGDAAGTRLLVVSPKKVRNALEKFSWPEGIAFAHFNALRGIDKFKNVPAAIIIGREMPPTNVLEAKTEALFYDDPNVQEVRRRKASLRKAQRTYAWPTVRQFLFLASNIRTLGLRRFASRWSTLKFNRPFIGCGCSTAPRRIPAEIIVFGQVDTGLAIHELRDWVDAKTDPLARRRRLGRVVGGAPHPPATRQAECARRWASGSFANAEVGPPRIPALILVGI